MQALCATEGSISGFSRIETRSQRQLKALKEHTASNVATERTKSASYTFTNYFIPVVKNVIPLPELDWADPKEVWSIMLQKDRQYCRDPLYFRRHSVLQPRMRAILLDWLTEVSTSLGISVVPVTRLCSMKNFRERFEFPSILAGVPGPKRWSPK